MTKDQFSLLDDLLTESTTDENNDTFGTQRHDVSIPVPQTTQLTTKQHDAALTALKQSFKEAADIIDSIMNAEIVDDKVYDEQAEFTENALTDALYESVINGPLFEKVDRTDKEAVKNIVKTIGPKVGKFVKQEKTVVYKPYKFVLKLLTGAGLLAASGAISTAAGVANMAAAGINVAKGAAIATGAIEGAASGAIATSISQCWSQHAWQFIGTIGCEKADIQTFVDSINKEFAEDLGEYRILYVSTTPNLADLFRTKFNWKNHNQFYLLLVDKKLPKEITKGIKDTDKALASSGEEKKEEPKNDNE
jgi:hypothetical protein